MIVRDPDRSVLKNPEPNCLDSHMTAWGVHHGVLLVVLDQLRQAVEHLATVHVEFFVYIPEQEKEFICFQSILAIFPSSCVITIENIFWNNWIYSQMDFWENKNFNFSPVLRILEILVRIRIRGSINPDPAIFVSDIQDVKKILFPSSFLLITFWRYTYIIFHR